MHRDLVILALIVGTSWMVSFASDAFSMPDAVRIPIVSPHPPGAPQEAALFRHGTHAQSNCYGCHPGLFPRHRQGFTHADMATGSFCAGCHNGQGADAIATMACGKCHVAE